MYEIRFTKTFRKSFKRIIKSGKSNNLTKNLELILFLFVNNQNIPSKYKDHELAGDYSGYRELHLKPDLLLIYKKDDSSKTCI